MFSWLRNWSNKKAEVQLSNQVKKGKRISKMLNRTYKYRVELEMGKLKNAIKAAQNYSNPNRQALYAIYEEVLADSQVFSQVRTLRNKVTASKWRLEGGSEEDEKMLNKSWFLKYMRYWVDTKMWGHTLVEFVWKEDFTVDLICVVDREHVHPWSGQVVLNTSATKGVAYREEPACDYIQEMGDDEDLGLLRIVAKEAIFKNYARTDWSRYSEKFGMPVTVAKMTGADDKERKQMANMLSNMGANSWAIVDDEDTIEMVETRRTDAYKVYLENTKLSDDYIAKVILGQTGTSDEKAWSGSADVHERILDTYVQALLTDLEFHINDELFPFLTNMGGYKLDGIELKFLDLEKKPMTKEEQEDEKKKLSLKLSISLPIECCDHDHEHLHRTLGFNIDGLFSTAIENVFKRRLKDGELDQEMWEYNVSQITQAIEQGAGISFASLDYEDGHHDLLRELRRNVYTFAAFKNYHNVGDMVEALTGEDGKTVSFSEFKEIAEQINKVYNENWLRTEYNTAIGQSQMALQWNDFESRKDNFPYLEYLATQDGRTRPEHEALHGVIRKVDDPFWDKYFPPNGYGCRCSVRSLAQAQETKELPAITKEGVPPEFRHNSGQDGQLYSNDHPYFKGVEKSQQDRILSGMRSFVLRDNSSYLAIYNQMKGSSLLKRKAIKEAGITTDDATSVNLYTGRGFQGLNLKLRKNARTDYDLYLEENINAALTKLKKQKGIVYRVINTNIKPDFILDLAEGDVFTEKGFFSSTASDTFTKQLLAKTRQKYRILMIVESKNGRVLGDLAAKDQAEVLFKSNTDFEVKSYNNDNDFITIRLKEK